MRASKLLKAAAFGATAACWVAPALASDIEGFASVREDGTLRIAKRIVRLYGIHIPKTPVRCRTFERPVRCGPQAILALSFKAKGFIHCDRKGSAEDGVVTAICHAGTYKFEAGDDLAAYLLERGWAVALPDAPVEYQAMEKVARYRRLGIWGFSVVPLVR